MRLVSEVEAAEHYQGAVQLREIGKNFSVGWAFVIASPGFRIVEGD